MDSLLLRCLCLRLRIVHILRRESAHKEIQATWLPLIRIRCDVGNIRALNLMTVPRRVVPVNTGIARYSPVASAHPAYTPKADRLRNLFLPLGQCVICNGVNMRVIRLRNCSHGICEVVVVVYALPDAMGYATVCL